MSKRSVRNTAKKLKARQKVWEEDSKRQKPHEHHKPGSQNRNK